MQTWLKQILSIKKRSLHVSPTQVSSNQMFCYNVVRYFFGYAIDQQGVKKQSVNQEPVNKQLVNNTYVKSQSSRSKGNHIYHRSDTVNI